MAKKFNYFSARLKVVPSDAVMRVKPANTIQISGVGKYLGGKFYVQDITKTLDTSGFSVEMTIIKVKFPRASVKPKKKIKGKKSGKGVKKKTHKVKKGETLLSICNKYFKKSERKKHLNKMKKKNNIKNEKEKLKVGRKIYIV